METKPFEHMRILTTKEDEDNTDALLNKSKKQGLICQQCGSTRFVVEAYVKTQMEVLNESEVSIVMGVNPEVAYVNRVVECAICRSKKMSPISIS